MPQSLKLVFKGVNGIKVGGRERGTWQKPFHQVWKSIIKSLQVPSTASLVNIGILSCFLLYNQVSSYKVVQGWYLNEYK